MEAYKSFETHRLQLRPTGLADADFIQELMNTPKWKEFIGDRNIHSLADAEIYIEKRMLPQLERLGFCHYTMIRKSDRRRVGACGLYDRENREGVDIGFALLPQYEGLGFAYEGAERIKQAALEEFKVTVLSGITRKDNFASQKLLKRLGLKFVGFTHLPEEQEEMLLFRL